MANSWRISCEYLLGRPEPTEEEIIRFCLCHTSYLHKFFKLHISQTNRFFWELRSLKCQNWSVFPNFYAGGSKKFIPQDQYSLMRDLSEISLCALSGPDQLLSRY